MVIRWCSVQQVDFENWSAKFCLRYCLDVNLVRIYLCTYCKGHGRKKEVNGTCVSARFVVYYVKR